MDELAAKYQKTTDGNWYVTIKQGFGESHCVIQTDKPQAMTGKFVASFGSEFGQNNAEFCMFCHQNMHKILDLVDQCKLIQQWHQRGVVGEPNRALWMKNAPLPEGWVVEDRVPEVDGFVPILKTVK